MRLDPIASMIDSPQSAPGTTSRGATQQRIDSASSLAQNFSRNSLVFDRVAYKNIMSHGRCSAFPTAFVLSPRG